ncbi:MAG: hypothetical protein WCA09_06180, partial [Burkholderiales bacterium]
LAAFLCGPVSINVASRAAGKLPVLVRASGCRVAPDRRRVTLFLARSKSEAVIEALCATRVVAAVFTLPSSHRSVQLKGTDAEVGAPAAGDIEQAQRYIEAFAREIDPLGYRPDMGRALLWLDAADLVALTFTPSTAFMQTPGPGAGAPLRPVAA